MLFGLRKAEAIYQRMMNKVYDKKLLAIADLERIVPPKLIIMNVSINHFYYLVSKNLYKVVSLYYFANLYP